METNHIVSAIFGTVLKIVFAMVIVAFVFRGAMAGYEFGYRVFKQQPMALGEGRTVTVKVSEDMTPKQMGELFKKNGLVNDTTLFLAQYYMSEFRENVRPGTYELSTSMTVEEMMEIMATHTEEEDGESR